MFFCLCVRVLLNISQLKTKLALNHISKLLYIFLRQHIILPYIHPSNVQTVIHHTKNRSKVHKGM